MLFLPAPLFTSRFDRWPSGTPSEQPTLPFYPYRFTPHYPAKSPLDDILRLVVPGSDEFKAEKYAFEIKQVLDTWTKD